MFVDMTPNFEVVSVSHTVRICGILNMVSQITRTTLYARFD